MWEKLTNQLNMAATDRNWKALAIELEYSLDQIHQFEMKKKEKRSQSLLKDWMVRDGATLDRLKESLIAIDQQIAIHILENLD